MSHNATIIIAEAGVNHNGQESLAYELIDAASEAGADVVKFQIFSAAELVSHQAPKAAYQMERTERNESHLEMLRRLELGEEVFPRLAAHCAKRGVVFMATPFDERSLDFLMDLKPRAIKLSSGEITNMPFLRMAGSKSCEILLSTGMSTLDEVGDALAILEEAGAKRAGITLLHCTTEYPAPIAEVNLLAMRTMQERFPGIKGVGYSDHTKGITVPIAAVALGATVIEKHFTLDCSMEGPDHGASLEPDLFARMVRAVREVEAALGDGVKVPSPAEGKNRDVARKSIVASRDIKAGECLSPSNLTTKRPGTGISPMQWENIVGLVAPEPLEQDEVVPPRWLKPSNGL